MVDTFDISLMKAEVCALASRIRLAMGTCRRSKHVAILPSSLDMLPIYPLTTIQVEMDVATALVDGGFIGIECALLNTRDHQDRDTRSRRWAAMKPCPA